MIWQLILNCVIIYKRKKKAHRHYITYHAFRKFYFSPLLFKSNTQQKHSLKRLLNNFCDVSWKPCFSNELVFLAQCVIIGPLSHFLEHIYRQGSRCHVKGSLRARSAKRHTNAHKHCAPWHAGVTSPWTAREGEWFQEPKSSTEYVLPSILPVFISRIETKALQGMWSTATDIVLLLSTVPVNMNSSGAKFDKWLRDWLRLLWLMTTLQIFWCLKIQVPGQKLKIILAHTKNSQRQHFKNPMLSLKIFFVDYFHGKSFSWI